MAKKAKPRPKRRKTRDEPPADMDDLLPEHQAAILRELERREAAKKSRR